MENRIHHFTMEQGHHSLADQINATESHILLEAAAKYYFQISQKHGHTREYFSSPEGEVIKVDETSVRYIPLYRDDSGKMLVLVDSKTGESVVAVYLNGTWRSVDDILRSSDPSKEGLIQVQTFGERIALFVLNCLVCGFSEANGSGHEAYFLPHASRELAKIFWCHGEAVGFYTYKNKVCHKFLTCNPKDQDRFWEVEAPGYWSQRVNIWLKIQLGEAPAMQKSFTESNGEQDKRVSILAVKHPGLPNEKNPGESPGNLDEFVSLGNYRKRKSVKLNVEEISTKHMKTT
ncbi:hypothetical protein XENTR_v10009350 [Xenopus tropicalis]|nr:protein FAM169B isoform X4 [Xenopus tropicalis]KAE8618308.1 hypothetical protein XENTR_v10009350 [Xenopus tropicalis]